MKLIFQEFHLRACNRSRSNAMRELMQRKSVLPSNVKCCLNAFGTKPPKTKKRLFTFATNNLCLEMFGENQFLVIYSN